MLIIIINADFKHFNVFVFIIILDVLIVLGQWKHLFKWTPRFFRRDGESLRASSLSDTRRCLGSPVRCRPRAGTPLPTRQPSVCIGITGRAH